MSKSKIENVVKAIVANPDFIFMMEKVVGSFEEATADSGFLLLTLELHVKSASSDTQVNSRMPITINLREVFENAPRLTADASEKHVCCGTGCCDHESDGGS